MDNNNAFDSHQPEHQNRFIFSDDYYENMPLNNDNRLDVTKKVEYVPMTPSTEKAEDPLTSISKNDNFTREQIDQTSDFNQLVQNQYENSAANMFDFFGHNANVSNESNDSLESTDDFVQPSITLEEPIHEKNKTILNKNPFSNFENPFAKKKEDNVVHIDKPNVEGELYDIGPEIPLPIYQEPSSDSSTDSEPISIPLEPEPYAPPVEKTGIDEGLIHNIVDYHETDSNQLKEDFSDVVSDQTVPLSTPEKKLDTTNFGFMGNSIPTDSFHIDTGINQELEKELIKQKEIEEENKRKNNPDLADYLKYKSDDDDTEMVYRAGGKSIIREKVKESSPSTVITSAEDSHPISDFNQPETEEEPQIVNIDEEMEKEPHSIQDMIEDILDIPNLDEMMVPIDPNLNPGVDFGLKKEEKEEVPAGQNTLVYNEKEDNFDYDQNFDHVEVIKSDLLDQLAIKAEQEGKISILARYGEDFCSKDYITNPAIGRAEEIKQLILILLTPEKSGILIGKPGIGKTSIVEGLAYQLQRNNVPDALKGYRIVSVKTASLLGTLPTGETRLQTLVDELKQLDKIILFIDEVHMLIGATNESSLDFANMFKESLGRGSIKVIGATTTEEYERYILRDKAFVRRFQKVEVAEPDRTHTIKILMGTLPKIEKTTGAKLKYTEFIQSEIMAFIVDITTEYKRIYGIGSRYPDICLTLLAQAFSQAVFANRKEVTIIDIRKAIENSKNIYPDVIRKELINFDRKFKDIIREEEASK